MKIIPSAIIVCTILAFAACKKFDESSTPSAQPPAPVAKTKWDYLISGKWVMVSCTGYYRFMGYPSGTDIYSDSIPTCKRDDIYRFRNYGVLVIDEGATKCNPSDSQTAFVDKWSIISDNELEGRFDPCSERTKALILKLDSDTLKLYYQASCYKSFGYTQMLTTTFKNFH